MIKPYVVYEFTCLLVILGWSSDLYTPLVASLSVNFTTFEIQPSVLDRSLRYSSALMVVRIRPGTVLHSLILLRSRGLDASIISWGSSPASS